MLEGKRIGFVGAGHMAEALARGLFVAHPSLRERAIASDKSAERLQVFNDHLSIRSTHDNQETVRNADVLVVAVKPQNMRGLFEEVGRLIGKNHMVLSIMAGIRTGSIEACCGKGTRVVRAMPNTALLVGEGASAIAPGRCASGIDLSEARAILECAGQVVEVDEHLLDAVTALSGSGPAYFLYVIEALVDAACAEGMDRETALALASQTMRGAAELIRKTGVAPEELRRRVTSPGGTTAEAIRVFDEADLKGTLARGVAAAAQRSRELGSADG